MDKALPAVKEALANPEFKSEAFKQKRKAVKDREGQGDFEAVFVSRWKGKFGLVILDEGHRIRHVITKIHASMLHPSLETTLQVVPDCNADSQ